jgi:hypothetical protein
MQTANRAKTASFVPDFTAAVGKDGVPIIQDRTGAFVDLKRTPEAGHYPVIVNPQSEKTTFRTKDTIYEVQPEGTIREGQEAPAKTIYVDKAGADKLIKLKEEGKNYDLLQDDKGSWLSGIVITSVPAKWSPVRRRRRLIPQLRGCTRSRSVKTAFTFRAVKLPQSKRT